MAKIIRRHSHTRRVIGIFGATGTGKTQCARAILRDERLPPRLLVLDPAEDYTGADVERVTTSREEVLDYLADVRPTDSFSVAYQPPPTDPDPEAAAFLARLAMGLGTVVLLLDEAHLACNQKDCSPDVLVAVRRGRHRAVSVVVVSQRPTDVHTSLRAEAYACETYFFRLSRRADLDDVALERGRAFSDIVARLPILEARRVTPYSTGKVRVKLRMRPRPPVLEIWA